MEGIQILSTGHYAPEKIMTNQDFEKIVETSDEWITSRTGIKQRHISESQNTSDLAVEAAKRALVGIDSSKIRYIVVATFTPDCFTPSVACLVAEKLGLGPEVMAFDLNAACSGFIYSLKVVNGLLKDDELALVIGSEVISKVTDFTDRNTCILFGDGAGAAVIAKSENKTYDYMGTRGCYDVLYCNGRTFNGVEEGYLYMNGKEVFKFATDAIEKSVKHILEDASLTHDDIDWIVCHQANERIIKHVSKKMKISLDKFYMNLQNYGNTSAASIPLALAEMNEEGLLKKGDKVIICGFGAGLTWGAMLLTI